MFRKILIGFFFFLVAVSSQAAIKARLNQVQVYDGDPVQLTIESDQKLSDQPDLSVLDKDFLVRGTSEGTRFSMVNGNSSFTQTWTITLVPKHKGEMIVPSIQLGSESTLPIKLTVADITPELRAQNREHVMLEAIVDIGKSLPYVQQQIPYTLKLYTDETIRQGDIFEPNIENAIIEQVSNEKQYGVVRNGKKFNVLERHYVISPEKSGKLIIPPAIFKGKQRIASNELGSGGTRGSRGVFDDFFDDPFFGSPFGNQGKPITTRSDSIEIAVQTIPDNYHGKNWLPAEDLVVIDSWDKELPVFRVGEPVVRTLVLQAKGLAGSQIPKLVVPEPEKMRTYPDQEKVQTKSDGTTVYGLFQQSVSYIPNAEGKLEIPAIKVDWWDVVASKENTFEVAARKIVVLPGTGQSNQYQSGKHTGTNTNSVTQEAGSKLVPDVQEPTAETSSKAFITWVFVMLSLGGLGVYFVYKLLRQEALGKSKYKNDPQTEPKISTQQLLKKLEVACSKNDNKTAAKLLLELGKKQWPANPPKSLGTLANRLASGSKIIKQLEESLYAAEPDNKKGWNGSMLWGEFKRGLQPVVEKRPLVDEGLVVSLYPDR